MILSHRVRHQGNSAVITRCVGALHLVCGKIFGKRELIRLWRHYLPHSKASAENELKMSGAGSTYQVGLPDEMRLCQVEK